MVMADPSDLDHGKNIQSMNVQQGATSNCPDCPHFQSDFNVSLEVFGKAFNKEINSYITGLDPPSSPAVPWLLLCVKLNSGKLII